MVESMEMERISIPLWVKGGNFWVGHCFKPSTKRQGSQQEMSRRKYS
jgi:hypothetical protein